MVCGSGEVVVCHDASLERLAGRAWTVARTDYSRLRLADVGSRLGYSPAQIPLLSDVVAALPAHFILNIELKCDGTEDLGLAVKVGRLVTELGVAGRVVLSSFNALCLFRLAAAYPTLRRGYLLDPGHSFALHAGLVAPLVSNHSIHPPDVWCDRARVEGWRARGWSPYVWTVDDGARARELAGWGVSGCITNRPGALRRALT